MIENADILFRTVCFRSDAPADPTYAIEPPPALDYGQYWPRNQIRQSFLGYVVNTRTVLDMEYLADGVEPRGRPGNDFLHTKCGTHKLGWAISFGLFLGGIYEDCDGG